mmetsp:Transcript_6716/g.15362  ORF Transcript_6716/g.15362 Transcript_6716/m.15362 type:complete len:268 (+) Transcript_6716:80-883(+)
MPLLAQASRQEQREPQLFIISIIAKEQKKANTGTSKVPGSCCLSEVILSQCLGHVLGAEINGCEVVKELVLLQPKNAIVDALGLTDLLNFGKLFPARAVVVESATLELSFAPRVADLDHAYSSPSNIMQSAKDGVGVTVHDAICVFGVRPILGATTHDVVLIFPGTESIEKFMGFHPQIQVSTTTHFGPGHGPEASKTLLWGVGELLPLVFVGVVGTIAAPTVAIVSEGVDVLASQEESEGVRAGASVNLIVSTTMSCDSLLQVAYP